MPETVSIAYRGARYALGQGPQFYGIWHAAAPQAQPLEWWPLTPEGWTGAWSRFAAIEEPGTITQVIAPQPSPAPAGPAGPAPALAAMPGAATAAAQTAAYGSIDPGYGQVVARPADPARMNRNARIGAGLLAVGLILGVVGLFPAYTAGVSLASNSTELVPHLIYLAAWAASGVLILFSGMRRPAGALLGIGVSAVTLGLFFADAGIPMADGGHLADSGLILSIIGWVACTAGAFVAYAASGTSARSMLSRRRGPAQQLGHPAGRDVVPMVTLILAAIGAAIAFAPSWDSFLLRTASGFSQTVTEGNAFANPAPVIVGDVLVMVLLVATVVVAALWRPSRIGAALAGGAIIPLVAQAISALIQIGQPTSPLQFNISQAQASSLGLTIGNGLTPMFWVYCAFVAILILLCLWMVLTTDRPAAQALPATGQPYWPGTAASAGGGGQPGIAGSSAGPVPLDSPVPDNSVAPDGSVAPEDPVVPDDPALPDNAAPTGSGPTGSGLGAATQPAPQQ